MSIVKALSMALSFAALAVCAARPVAFAQSNVSSTSSIDSEIAEHFRAGQDATRAGQADRAIHEYREVLRLRPGLTEARVNLGLDYFLAGQYQQAVVELERARQEKPELIPTNLFLGLSYGKLGMPAKAIPPLNAVLRQDPANQEALRNLGACYLDRGNYLEAMKVYQKLFATDADPVDGWYVLGHNYMAMALRLGDENARKFAGTPWEARLNGDVLVEDQKWVDAAAQYRRALTHDEKIPGLHAALGDMLLRQGKLEDAEAEYHAELQHDARSEAALLGLAETDLQRGSATPALERVTKIWEVFPPFLVRRTDFPSGKLDAPKLTALAQDLASAPDSPARQFLLASLDRAAGLNDVAAQQWSGFLASFDAWSANQKSVGARTGTVAVACAAHRYAECSKLFLAQKMRSPDQDVMLGQAELALGNEQAAAAAFAETLIRDPSNAQASYWLIKSFQPLALECLNHMAELAPDSWRVHQIRGEYFQAKYDYKKAVEEFRLALRAHPDSAELHEQFGNACLLNKNEAEGKAEIERALAIDPARVSSLYLLGRLYFQNHDNPRSIEYFQAALRFDPRFLPAHAALGRAYMRAGKPAIAAPELERSASTDEYGDLHYLLSMAYRQLGKSDLAAQALAVSQELRKKSAAHHEAGVAAAEGELADQ